ncbi:MAG: MarR family transcriptional regulator [Burkholderiales bacterium]|nr:MarR family transcriptional regulator [Burkholderiales bacterium]MDE2566972.1 MarR family transcriptional regulator [Burkholderiales bacterium]
MATVEERFSAALHSTARAWRLAVDRRLRHLGMSQASWLTVAMVARAKAPLPQVELAQRVGVEGATMAVMLNRLARAGLVERTASRADRRVKHVTLTPAGEALYEQVRTQAGAVRKTLLKGLEPAALLAATELLEQLQAALDAEP